MTYDPDCGHHRGADGTPKGFNQPQGVGDAPSTLLDGLRNWWKFDDDGTWTDSISEEEYFTEVNSPGTVTGKINYGIGTHGSSAPHLTSADVDLRIPSNGNTDWTLASWILPVSSGYGGSGGRTFAIWDTQFNFGMLTESSGNFPWMNGNIGGSWVNTDISGTAAAEIPDDTWGLCFWQFSAESGGSSVFTVRTIISGTERSASGSHSGTVAAPGTGYSMKIGFINSSYKAGADMDMMGIWTRHLTADERLELFNGGTGLDHPFS